VKKGFVRLTFIILLFYCAPKKVVKEMPLPAEIPVKDVTYLWSYKPAVNVREQASAESNKIKQLADGDSVVVLKNINGWYQIILSSGEMGYIRSDLLAPKECAIFPKAIHFIDSLKENRNIEVFFDKQDQHKQIYISYPNSFYTSEGTITQATEQLVDRYQESVYAGSVTAYVLEQDSKEMYRKYDFSGIANADVLLPVLPFGRLENIKRILPDKIILVIDIPDGIGDRELLSASRKMSASYPTTYTHVEFRFFNRDHPCRFWFLEDASGEQYQYNHCP
jgi:hypothetical protein